jgi:hypothetical protein
MKSEVCSRIQVAGKAGELISNPLAETEACVTVMALVVGLLTVSVKVLLEPTATVPKSSWAWLTTRLVAGGVAVFWFWGTAWQPTRATSMIKVVTDETPRVWQLNFLTGGPLTPRYEKRQRI